jgi:hypothetical protein
MKLVEEYLRHAEECRKLAAQSGPEQRKTIEGMGDVWEKLAEERRVRLEREERDGTPNDRR